MSIVANQQDRPVFRFVQRRLMGSEQSFPIVHHTIGRLLEGGLDVDSASLESIELVCSALPNALLIRHYTSVITKTLSKLQSPFGISADLSLPKSRVKSCMLIQSCILPYPAHRHHRACSQRVHYHGKYLEVVPSYSVSEIPP